MAGMQPQHGAVNLRRIVLVLVLGALAVVVGAAIISPETFTDGLTALVGRLLALLHGIASHAMR